MVSMNTLYEWRNAFSVRDSFSFRISCSVHSETGLFIFMAIRENASEVVGLAEIATII